MMMMMMMMIRLKTTATWTVSCQRTVNDESALKQDRSYLSNLTYHSCLFCGYNCCQTFCIVCSHDKWSSSVLDLQLGPPSLRAVAVTTTVCNAAVLNLLIVLYCKNSAIQRRSLTAAVDAVVDNDDTAVRSLINAKWSYRDKHCCCCCGGGHWGGHRQPRRATPHQLRRTSALCRTANRQPTVYSDRCCLRTTTN